MSKTEPIKHRMDWNSRNESRKMRQRVIATIHGAWHQGLEARLKGRHRSSAEIRTEEAWHGTGMLTTSSGGSKVTQRP